VPTPTAEQIQAANLGGVPAQRGAAVYFAQGCHLCHGALGQAPDELALFDLADLDESLRRGRPGMPIYGPDKISDAQLKDLLEYMKTFPNPEEEG
jgi:mono/diheme cytochrome c family protein